MGLKYLWDTNTVIYYLQNQFPPGGEKFIEKVLEGSDPAFSVITEIELLCWKTSSKKDIQILHGFIENSLVIELSNEIKLVTAELRKEFKVKLPDAIIAATAICHGLTLLSRNVKDFDRIEDLSLMDPHKQKVD